MLISQYKSIFGLQGLSSGTNYTIFLKNATFNNKLKVSGTSTISGNVTMMSNLNISNTSIIEGNIYSNNLYTYIFNNNTSTLLSNIYITNNSYLNNTTILSNLYVNNSLINNNLFANNLYVSNNSIINGNISILSNLNIINCQLSNINISKNINVSNNSILNNNATFKNLNVSGYTFINNGTFSNNLLISGSTFINNNLISNNLNVKNNLTVNNPVSLYNLYISNTSIFQSNVTCNSLFISGTTVINNNVSLNSFLYVNGSTLINNNLQINNNLNITNTAILQNITCFSNLYVSGNSVFNNSVILNNNATIISNLNIIGTTNISSTVNISTLVSLLPEYSDNYSALINNIPIWGLYRTGDIVKVRLGEDLPIISIIGATTLSLNIGSTYTDPGIVATSAYNDILNPYVSSIKNTSNSELLSSSININNLSTFINTNILDKYIITYEAIDMFNNTNRINRYINILDTISPTLYLSGSSTVTSDYTLNYVDPGVYAIDNYDNFVQPYLISFITGSTNILTTQISISGQTTITGTSNLSFGTYILTYKATDSSGNYSTITRSTIIQDALPPTLYLTGPSSVTSYTIINYMDPGVYAYDIRDGTVTPYLYSLSDGTNNFLTNQIAVTTYTIISGTSNLSVGNYTLGYKATDLSGNVGTITRSLYITDNIVSTNLLSWWKFDYPTILGYDSMGNYNFNMYSGYELQFYTADKVKDYGCASSGIINSLRYCVTPINLGQFSGFSFSYWVKVKNVSTTSNGFERFGPEFNYQNTNGIRNTIFHYYDNSLKQVILQIRSGTTSGGISTHQLSSTNFFDLNTPVWKHVVLTYEKVSGENYSDNKFNVYINNVNLLSSTIARYPQPGTGNLTFGRNDYAVTGSAEFLLDDFRLYNRAITSTEVSQIYNGM